MLTEALDYLNRGLVEYDVDFLAQYHLGVLYLNGENSDDNVIDLPSAEHHLRLAARYCRPLIEQMDDWEKRNEVSGYCAEAFFHASVACYAQAGESRRSGNLEDAEKKLREAVELASESVDASSVVFTEAEYHLAKYYSLLGVSDKIARHLRKAIVEDHKYLLKASVDADFDGAREHIDAFGEELRREVKEVATESISHLTAWQEEIRDLTSSNTLPQKQTDELVLALEQCSREITRTAEGGSYFDYWQALQMFFSFWTEQRESLLRELLGNRQANQVIEWTRSFSILSEGVSHEVRFQGLGPHVVFASNWTSFQLRRTLWAPELLLGETSRLSKVTLRIETLIDYAPEEAAKRLKQDLAEVEEGVGRGFPRDVLSASHRLELILRRCLDSFENASRQQRKEMSRRMARLNAMLESGAEAVEGGERKRQLGKMIAIIWGVVGIVPSLIIAAVLGDESLYLLFWWIPVGIGIYLYFRGRNENKRASQRLVTADQQWKEHQAAKDESNRLMEEVEYQSDVISRMLHE